MTARKRGFSRTDWEFKEQQLIQLNSTTDAGSVTVSKPIKRPIFLKEKIMKAADLFSLSTFDSNL